MFKTLILLLGLLAGNGSEVDLHLRPAGCTDGETFVDVVAVADSDLPIMSAAVSLIVESNLTYLRFETTPGMWMIADTLPDPDGINDDTADGQFILTCLSSPSVPTVMQTCGTVIGTLVFESGAGLGHVHVPRERGEWAETTVYLFDVPNQNVIGSIRGTRVACR